MRTKILILGGGLAGTIVANGLVRRLASESRSGDVTITVLGNTPKHMYQPGLLYVPFGRAREQELFRDERTVLDRRISLIIDAATRIDVADNRVHAQSGRSFDYDYLVIATGSRLAPELVPGLAESAHQFYDLPGAKKLRDALAEFKGGRIVLNVNAPHKCPVAPVEMSLMLDEFLRERGLGGKFEITYTYPIGRLHALEPLANWMVPEFERRGIKSQNFFNTQAVDGAAKTITSEEGDTLSYDLLITIPPHRGAQVIEDSGLGKMGWVPTNPKTLLCDGTKNVFVVGDTTNIPISKAGSTAHFEADTVVDNLAMLVQEGRWSRDYDGKVFCFIETGMNSGTHMWFNYATPPQPSPPTQMVHWFKLAYNRMYWLSACGLL
jgi:sulfide:quinone oxidoreductase